MRKIDKSDLVGLEAFEGGLAHKKFLNEALGFRVKVLKTLDHDEIMQVASLSGGELVDCKIDETTEWALAVKPFPKFEAYYFLQRSEPEFEDRLLALYSKEALNIGIPAEDVSDFTILYANVFIYSAKRVKKDLPKISRYL